MRNLNKLFGAIAIFALLFTSCSKDNDVLNDPDTKATLSFGSVLNDLTKQATKQQATNGIPTCSDDVPAYVEVILTGEENVGSIEDPLVIEVNPTPIEENGENVYFTEESADLELTPGSYQLTYFAVFNADDEMIWLAPAQGGDLADFVDTPLPADISLGAGVKKYVDVEVLCFDDRMVNLYGYLFFDIIGKEAFEFCFFANYCNDAGRHFPAHFSVEIWLEDGTVLYSDVENAVSTDGEDPSADPVCFALPNITEFADDEDYIHYRLTLLDWDGVYGEVSSMEIEGSLSRNDILANLNNDGETVEYQHERFGCGDDPGDGNGNGGDGNGEEPVDADNDGVVDADDDCPDTPQGVEVDAFGCPIDDGNGGDEGCLPDADQGCESSIGNEITVSAASPAVTELSFGDATVSIDEDGLFVGVTPVLPFEISDVEVSIGNETTVCIENIVPDEGGSIVIEGYTEADLPLYIEISANICDVSGN